MTGHDEPEWAVMMRGIRTSALSAHSTSRKKRNRVDQYNGGGRVPKRLNSAIRWGEGAQMGWAGRMAL